MKQRVNDRNEQKNEERRRPLSSEVSKGRVHFFVSAIMSSAKRSNIIFNSMKKKTLENVTITGLGY